MAPTQPGRAGRGKARLSRTKAFDATMPQRGSLSEYSDAIASAGVRRLLEWPADTISRASLRGVGTVEERGDVQ